MPQYDVEIAGENLGAAMATLNASGIPTLTHGGDPAGPFEASRRRSLLRNPFFWVVLLIAIFFAQRLVSPGESDDRDPTYTEFLEQVQVGPETIDRVTVFTDDYELEVDEADGGEYRTGYLPRTEQTLLNALQRQNIETVVEPDATSLVDLLSYLLPFALFFGFFAFLVSRTRGPYRAMNWRPDQLRAVVNAQSPEDAEAVVRTRLGAVGEYQVGPTR